MEKPTDETRIPPFFKQLMAMDILGMNKKEYMDLGFEELMMCNTYTQLIFNTRFPYRSNKDEKKNSIMKEIVKKEGQTKMTMDFMQDKFEVN